MQQKRRMVTRTKPHRTSNDICKADGTLLTSAVWSKQQGGSLRFPAWVTSLRELRHLSLGHLAPAQGLLGSGQWQQEEQEQELSAAATSLSALQQLSVLKLGYSTEVTQDPLQQVRCMLVCRLYFADDWAGWLLNDCWGMKAFRAPGCRQDYYWWGQ